MLSALLLGAAMSASQLQTRPELTDYKETSTHADVMGFLQELDKASAACRLETIGLSTEGREMPLLLASRPLVTSPSEARRQGKIVIYIQANIHAGEVEGKEAILHLARKWVTERKGVLDKAVLLINPIYNADGNEKFAPQSRNRPGQNGPEMVGVRANGQGLDLNRDYVKAESPEMRATLERVWVRWRPEVMMDLHTTDGTRHGYPLTWAPPLNPNGGVGLYEFARDTMMPDIRKSLERKGQRTFDYGNDETREGKRGWYSVSAEARYSTNYAGLVNCIGVLSEALVYLPFKQRVQVTEQFVTEVVNYSVANKGKILAMRKRADQAPIGRALGTRFDYGIRGIEPIWLEKKPAKTGVPTDLEQVPLTVYDRFVPTRTSRLPLAYGFRQGDSADNVVQLLLRHGIRVERVVAANGGSWQGWTVKEAVRAEQPFQKHRLIRLEVAPAQSPSALSQGDYVVRCDQPLWPLIHHMLDPEGTDGALAWEYLGTTFSPGDTLPLVWSSSLGALSTEPVRP